MLAIILKRNYDAKNINPGGNTPQDKTRLNFYSPI